MKDDYIKKGNWVHWNELNICNLSLIPIGIFYTSGSLWFLLLLLWEDEDAQNDYYKEGKRESN